MSLPTQTKLITKADVREIATKHGCTTSYDGEHKTMWVYGAGSNDAIAEITKLEGEKHFHVHGRHTRAAYIIDTNPKRSH